MTGISCFAQVSFSLRNYQQGQAFVCACACWWATVKTILSAPGTRWVNYNFLISRDKSINRNHTNIHHHSVFWPVITGCPVKTQLLIEIHGNARRRKQSWVTLAGRIKHNLCIAPRQIWKLETLPQSNRFRYSGDGKSADVCAGQSEHLASSVN